MELGQNPSTSESVCFCKRKQRSSLRRPVAAGAVVIGVGGGVAVEPGGGAVHSFAFAQGHSSAAVGAGGGGGSVWACGNGGGFAVGGSDDGIVHFVVSPPGDGFRKVGVWYCVCSVLE